MSNIKIIVVWKKTLMKIYSKSRFSLELSSYAYSDENEARQYERVFLMLENVVKKKFIIIWMTFWKIYKIKVKGIFAHKTYAKIQKSANSEA